MSSKHETKREWDNPNETYRPVLNMPEITESEVAEGRKISDSPLKSFTKRMEKEKFIEKKRWWAPVRNGLVMDEGAVHFRKMGNSLWLFLYLLLNANRGTGILMRRVKTISLDMGLPRSTTFRWLKTLREGGYVQTHCSGRSLTIQISKWRPVGKVPELTQQGSQIRDIRSAESGTSEKPLEVGIMAPVKKESSQLLAPKKNTIKENILKSDIDNKLIDFKSLNPSICKTREELLAYDLAQALSDLPAFPLYLSYARKYPESLLREILGRVREVPPSQIKKNHGALFNYLIQKHAKQLSDGPRH